MSGMILNIDRAAMSHQSLDRFDVPSVCGDVERRPAVGVGREAPEFLDLEFLGLRVF